MNPSGTTFDPATLWLIAGWVLIALGTLVLLFALFKDRSRGRRRCPKCWYDMTGAPSLKCPECGRTARSERKLFKTRRRWRVVIAALLLLLLPGFVSLRVPRALEHGWLDAVPITLLRPALWWQRERGAELLEAIAYKPNPRLTNQPLSQWERMLFAAEIAKLLDNGSVDVENRRLLLFLLGHLGRDARVAVPAVQRLNSAGDLHVLEVMRTLTLNGVTDFTKEMIEAAHGSQQPERAERAFVNLGQFHTASGRPAAHELVKIAADGDQRIARELRALCMREVIRKPPPDLDSMKLMREVLRCPDESMHHLGFELLQVWLSTHGWSEQCIERLWEEELVPPILDCAMLFGRMYPDRRSRWEPRVVLACGHESSEVRRRALETLDSWLSSHADPRNRLIELLATLDTTSKNRMNLEPAAWLHKQLLATPALKADVAIRLARLGTDGAEFAALAIGLVLPHPDPAFRGRVIVEIGSTLGPERSAEFATTILQTDPDDFVRAATLYTIVKPYASLPAMQPLIEQSLADQSVPVLINACLAAGQLGRDEASVAARLEELTRHESPAVSKVAAAALEKLRAH